jgi:citrate lyase beta subunit/acyl dehydratase
LADPPAIDGAAAPPAPPSRRSCLAVPASSQRMLEKAATIAADELVFDLEDAVAPAAKDEARAAAAARLEGWEGAPVAVRVNALGTPWFERDVAALGATPGPQPISIVLPKAESAADLERVAWALSEAESAGRRRARPLGIQALVETAAGLARVEEIAAAGGGRLEALILGYADLAASLGRSREYAADPASWLAIQDRVLVAARANDLQAIDGPFLGTAADEPFLAAARHARDLGFDGKWAIHPSQVEALRQTFTPAAAEVEHARAVLAALARAEAEGGAGAVALDGEMLDEALAASARRILARAGGGGRMSAPRTGPRTVVAPFFEDLAVGQVADSAPALTLTEGHAATHAAILGDRLRLALDAGLSREVLGAPAPLAHPGLVCDVAIGQSTLLTQRVIGNLFYRGLALRRAPLLGDTLRTTTEVVALRQNSAKPGRAATGLAVLRVRTADQEGRAVLDFRRCAMLPLRDPEGETGHADDVDGPEPAADAGALAPALAGWDLGRYRELVPGPHLEELEPGTVWEVEGGDVVSSAPELARLSLNLASAHHDATTTGRGRRLVYGGHTIGVAASQLCRALPALATIVAWHSCDHLGPVFEDDTLRSAVELEATEALPGGGGLAHLRSRVTADREGERVPVLDWRLVGVFA